MGQHRLRILLEVVRRKHVIFRRDEGLEKTPSTARDEAERPCVGSGKQPAARDNRLRTRRFTAQVRKYIALARQDVTALVSAAEVIAALDEARDHIDRRQQFETRMLESIRYVLDHPLTAENARRLTDIAGYVEDCRGRLAILHAEIMTVLPTLLGEQERQRFHAPAAPLSTVALRRDVLGPVLQLAVDAATPVAEAFVSTVAGPRPPLLANLDLLGFDLLTPVQERRREQVVDGDLALSAIAGQYSRFTPEQIAAGRRMLERALTGCRLSDLLLAADQEGDLAVTTLVALGGLSAFADRADLRTGLSEADTRLLVPEELSAEADGARLRHPRFCGDDLMLGVAVAGHGRQFDVDLALPSSARTVPPASARRASRSRRTIEDSA